MRGLEIVSYRGGAFDGVRYRPFNFQVIVEPPIACFI
jgi:hypothetical protein